ncbi:MAG: hypothetical protein CYPHOPRED_002920 [Cyphobasidiales sp. Tagirdzhanova-0007]|nr:MAG: hypothetical protein CYPHOPRED_002920 [Cyphobasidiales sp. Tagirdzhanova-0007]
MPNRFCLAKKLGRVDVRTLTCVLYSDLFGLLQSRTQRVGLRNRLEAYGSVGFYLYESKTLGIMNSQCPSPDDLDRESLLKTNVSAFFSQPIGFVKRIKDTRTRQLAVAACIAVFGLLAFLWRSNPYSRSSSLTIVDWRNITNQRQTLFKTLTEDQCDVLFHPLYVEIDRAALYWKGRGGITREDIETSVSTSNAHLLLYDNQLYVKSFHNLKRNSRPLAQVALINEAISTSPERLPNIEFTIRIKDIPQHVKKLPIWELCRESHLQHVWLQPDFGFYSWPEPGVGSFQEVMHKATKHENDSSGWNGKKKKLFWKGNMGMNSLRKALADAVSNKSWADIQDIHCWKNNEARLRMTMDGHCDFKYLAHVEGQSYSGCLNINSDVTSPDQNTVVIPGHNWDQLPDVMESLLADDGRAKRIADNSYEFWRYWNSPAATSCYLRQMFRSWAVLQKFEPVLSYNDTAYNSFDLMRKTDWVPH